jgi:hypothetical protein
MFFKTKYRHQNVVFLSFTVIEKAQTLIKKALFQVPVKISP